MEIWLVGGWVDKLRYTSLGMVTPGQTLYMQKLSLPNYYRDVNQKDGHIVTLFL